MDVHRCRFVSYPPSTINALAFSQPFVPKNQKKESTTRLAIGRANGDIEIWNPLRGSWLQETIIHGGKDRSIDGLVWIQEPSEEIQGKTYVGKYRLFSIGYTTTVTEWDLPKGRPLRQASGNHGEIWCLAAQPQFQNQVHGVANHTTEGEWRGQNLITGCTDGALVLYSTKDDGLELQRVLVRPSVKKAKVISVVFQNRYMVVAGCSDSTIRIYDIRNGNLFRSMSLGSGVKGGPKETIVWSVKVLRGGDIVCGDSTGELKIWDGKTYTLKQRIKGHRQDIFSLATSHDGFTIFSGGMDRRTVIYKPGGKGRKRWEEIVHRRFHDHDVKTMASYEAPGMSVVISGGPDASPIATPLEQHGFENQRALPFLPQWPTLRSAPRKRLMMSWWDREVHIWRFKKPSKTSTDNQEEDSMSQNRKLVAKVLIKGEANITSATLSEDGSLLAVSTIEDVKLFHLRYKKDETGDTLKVSKVTAPTAFSFGARLVQFSPDSKWLSIVRPDNHIFLTRITSSMSSLVNVHPQLSKISRLDRKIEKSVSLGGLGSYDRTIIQTAFSSDSRILAVSDLAGYIDTFVLSGHEDLTQIPSNAASSATSSPSLSSESESSDEDDDNAKPKLIYGQYWTRNPNASSLPKLPSAPTVLSFRPASNASHKQLTNGLSPHPTRNNPNPIPKELPAGEDRMLVITATSQVFEFEVLHGRLSPWSRRNPTSMFSESFRKLRDQAKGAFWDVKDGRERVWLYGVGWLWMFDLSRDLPVPRDAAESSIKEREAADTAVNGGVKQGRKRKRQQSRTTGAGGVIPDPQLTTGISRNMKIYNHEDSLVTHDIAPRNIDTAMEIAEEADDDDDDDEDQELNSSALQKLRRGPNTDEDVVESMNVNHLIEGQRKTDANPEDDDFKHEWHTFKYRPILGICLLSSEDDTDVENQDSGLEIAIVERPIWEADLPPRYYGDQEWEKRDL